MIGFLDLIYRIIGDITDVFLDASIFILVGFLAAGIMNALIPPAVLYKYLGGRRKRSVILATLIGAPLPLCSCSVLPAALNLKKKGAGSAASIAFLISTPETGVESIAITYGLMGWVTAIFRPVAAMFTAIIAGVATAKWGEEDPPVDIDEVSGNTMEHENGDGCSVHHEHMQHGDHSKKTRLSFRESLNEIFGSFFDETAYWLLFGLVLSGIIAALVPDEIFAEFLGTGILSMPLMLLIGIPIYICASSSTPIAAMMVMKGLNPGAALVFLLAGPASNLGSLALLSRYFGKRTMAIYLLSIAVGSLFMGALFNFVVNRFNVDLAVNVRSGIDMLPFPLRFFGLVLFLLLMGRALYRTVPPDEFLRAGAYIERWTGFTPTRRKIFSLTAITAFLLLAGTMLVEVDPGEVVIVKRFGEPVATYTTSGLKIKAPYPFDTTESTSTEYVHSVPIGFVPVFVKDNSGNPLFENTRRIDRKKYSRKTLYVTGDENIVDCTAVVHYLVKDPWIYMFELSSPDSMINVEARNSLISIVMRDSIDNILSDGREKTEEKAARLLQKRLDNMGSGVEVVSLSLLNVHAPREVHFAFRDLASAREDMNTNINKARIYMQETVKRARGEAEKMIERAKSSADSLLMAAQGESDAFLKLAETHRNNRKAVEDELYLETVENKLKGIEKSIVPGESSHKTELWCLPSPSDSPSEKRNQR